MAENNGTNGNGHEQPTLTPVATYLCRQVDELQHEIRALQAAVQAIHDRQAIITAAANPPPSQGIITCIIELTSAVRDVAQSIDDAARK